MPQPQKFRSKPIEVLAMQLTKENRADILKWMGEGNYGKTDSHDPVNIHIKTVNGVAVAAPGTWVVKGVQDFYPCDDTTFRARWEAVRP